MSVKPLRGLVGRNTKLLKLFFTFGFVLLLLIVDQVSKDLALKPTFNSGFFLGSFEWLSGFYRIFCAAAFLVLNLLVISLIQYLTWRSYPAITAALVLFETGMIGNGIDKIRFGAVRDFIEIPTFHSSLILNMADLYQWAGILALLVLIWINPGRIWPKENLRNKLLIFPASQLRMISVLLLITVLIALGNFILLGAYLKSNQILFHFSEAAIGFTLFLLIALVVIFIFGLFWSNRIYGPFLAVERYIKMRNSPGKSEIKIRTADETECVKRILTLLKKDDEPKN